jgi:hypothetical protein
VPSFKEYTNSAKKLTFEGMTLTSKTATIFSDLRETSLERLEEVTFSIISDEEDPDACSKIAEVMGKLIILHKFEIIIWRESQIHNLFRCLNELREANFFKTVKHLKIVINEDVMSLSENQEGEARKEIHDFIIKFQNLQKFNSYPRDGYNPFPYLNAETLMSLTVDLPSLGDDIRKVCEFLQNSQLKKLKLFGGN